MRDCETILREKRQYFETYLQTLPVMEEAPLRQAITYSLHGSGKRLRPALFLLAASLYRRDCDDLLPFAAAIEMIHTYSLVHDDLPAMDDDDFRRGRPTCHKVYGEGLAILAGDGLLTEAFRLMASVAGKAVSERRLLRAISEAGNHAGLRGMVLGQSYDIMSGSQTLTLTELRRIYELKTGGLIRLSLTAGALLAGAAAADIDALDDYGYHFGLAFQITDDILDQEGTFASLGKPIGSDIDQQKMTYCRLLGPEKAAAEAAAAISAAVDALQPITADTTVLAELAQSLLYRQK